MKKLSDLEYLKLGKLGALWYNIQLFICAIPAFFAKIGLGIWNFIKGCVLGVKNEFCDIGRTFKNGNWAVKLSFFVFGIGNIYYGQVARGIFFLLFELIFIGYMVLPTGGAYWLAKCNWFQTGTTVGTVQGAMQYNPIYDINEWVPGDNSGESILEDSRMEWEVQP